jgi:hypothetical protein
MPARLFSRDDLSRLLEERGAYAALERALGEALSQLHARHGIGEAQIDEGLLVGGSSLLPQVDARVRRLLPSARVGEWNPFGAVATGACEFARGMQILDQIYHDYALRMADTSGKQVYYELIVPAGARYPTKPELEVRIYSPDPGSPGEMLFEVCEVTRLGHAPVAWSEEPGGRRVWRPTSSTEHGRALVINEGETRLELPPTRRSPRRVRVEYRVDADRYLRWTVRDGEHLLRDDTILGRLR